MLIYCLLRDRRAGALCLLPSHPPNRIVPSLHGKEPPVVQKCPSQHPPLFVYPGDRVLTVSWTVTLSGRPFWGDILPWVQLHFPTTGPSCALEYPAPGCPCVLADRADGAVGKRPSHLLPSRPHFLVPLLARLPPGAERHLGGPPSVFPPVPKALHQMRQCPELGTNHT